MDALVTAEFEVPALFDSAWYRARYPDVVSAGMNSWRHYVEYGITEGRDPNPIFDTDWYLSTYRPRGGKWCNPLVHYCERGHRLGYEPNAWFDSAWYLARNGEARALRMSAPEHYLRRGAAQGREPSANFDSQWYRRSNPDLRFGRLTPLGDYLQYGRHEGRTASPARPHAAVARSGRARVAVYTAIIGDYDSLKIPARTDPACDYYCFTDRDISWQDVWIPRQITWRHEDPVRMARQIKVNAHEYLADYEWSIWLDANLQLNCGADALVLAGPWDLATWQHPFRDCTYAEAAVCLLENKDDAATIVRQMDRYREQGLAEHAGLVESSVLVRRHNTRASIAFARAWWDEICRGSRRDQLSFTFVQRQQDFPVGYLAVPGMNMRNDARLNFFTHVQPRAQW